MCCAVCAKLRMDPSCSGRMDTIASVNLIKTQKHTAQLPPWKFTLSADFHCSFFVCLPTNSMFKSHSSLCSYLIQLFFSVFLATQFVLRALPQLPQAVGFLLCCVDLIPQLLLQVHLLHFHCAVLLLGDLQPENNEGNKNNQISDFFSPSSLAA